MGHRAVWMGIVMEAFLLANAATGWAQARPEGNRPSVALEAVGGYTGFLDEEMIDHAVVGATLRVRLTRRLGVEMGVMHMWGPGEDTDWLFLPGVVFDLRGSGTVVPYLVAGAGWLRTTVPVGTGPFTSWTATVGGGGGIRFALAPRAYVAVEARLGTEPLTRLTAAVGWRF